MHLFASVVLFGVLIVLQQVDSSAIPMWEYLSRDEKMSYLYSMFANQVEEFCEFSEMNNCNNELLNYGLKQLKVMPNDHLDSMDPYQRGANNIIWGSMMDGHVMMQTSTTPRPRTRSTTVKPNSYDDDQGYQGDDFDTAASQSTGNIYQVLAPPNLNKPDPPKVRSGVHYIHPNYASIKASLPQYRLPPPQPTLYQQRYPNSQYQRRQFQPIYIPLNNNQDYLRRTDESQEERYYTNIGRIAGQYKPRDDARDVPLTGPMVVRVHLDGTPVQENEGGQHELPHDEDLRQYKMSKAKLPSF